MMTGTGSLTATTPTAGATRPALPPEPPENCSDGRDNDHDGVADCMDPDCVGDPACTSGGGGGTENCCDGIDNDGDWLVDCIDVEDCWREFIFGCCL